MQDLATTFAGYRLLDHIGRDAVSRTYRATAGVDGRTVALQVSAPLADGVERRRATLFQRRATAAMDVDHPGIARVLDVGIVDDRAYAATEWRPSVTLDQMIGQRWRMSVHETVTLLTPAAEGLDRAHTAGVVHAALGTRSIRIATDERPAAFVTGFGFDSLLALRLGSKQERDAAPVLDDLLYVAPELLRGGRIEPATDQYALACALYHCLAGEPPFIRDSASALFGAHLFARPRIPDVLEGPDHARVRTAIATGLAKEPDERHGSCAGLLRATAATGNGSAPAAAAAQIVAPPTDTSGVPPTTAGPRTSADADASVTPRTTTPRRVPLAALVAIAAIAGLVAALALIASVRGDATDPEPAGDVVGRDDAAPQDGPAADADAAPGDRSATDADPAATVTVGWRRAVADGRVRMLRVTDDAVVVVADGTIAAVDPATGDARWRAPIHGGEVTDATVTDDALAYRTSSGMTALAIDDGHPLWTRDDRYTPTGGLHAVASGGLYGMGPGRILPELMAMDPATGMEQWHFHGEDVPVRQNAAIAADDELVTILQNGTLFGLDPDAELYPSGADRLQIEDEVFRVDVTRPWRDSVTLLDDAVLLARRNSTVCSLERDDATRRWCRRVEGVGDAGPRLLVEDDTVVVVTRSTVTALDRATGGPRWSSPAAARITAATTTATTVVVAERGGRIRGLGLESGEERWSTDEPTNVTALAPSGDAVIGGTGDGALLRLEGAAGES